MKMAFVCFLVCCCVFISGEDWKKWRGNDDSGISQESIHTDWSKDGLPEIWRKPLGEGYSGITVSNRVLYTLFGDSNKEYCIAMNVESGETIWKKEIGDLFESDWGNGPRSTPTIDEFGIYVIGGNGDLYCLKVEDGKTLWHINIPKQFDTSNPRHGRACSPFIYGDMLFYNVGGEGQGIVAFDKKTGKVKWKSTDDEAAYSTPIIVEHEGEPHIIFFTGAGVVGLNPHNGKILWQHPWVTSYNVNAASPIYQDGYVFISSGYNSGALMVKIEKDENNYKVVPQWTSKYMKNHFSSSILWQEHLYGFHNAILTCMDFKTGEVQWTERGFQKGSLLGIDGHMIILGEKGNLALASLDSNEYKEKSQYELFTTKCWSVPTVVDGRMFIRNEKEMVCLDLRKKEEK